MTPKIKSGQEFVLEPCTWEQAKVGDMVYCKVKGSYFTHIVFGKNDDKGCLIGNNHGYMNGWTKRVYGRVIEVIKKK